MPFNIGCTLIVLWIGYFAGWPYFFFVVLGPVIIMRKTCHDINLRGKRRDETHLLEEFHTSFESQRSMSFVGEKVEFGRNLSFAQFSEYQSRGIGTILVSTAMVKTYRAGLVVKMEYGIYGYVRTVAGTNIGSASFTVT